MATRIVKAGTFGSEYPLIKKTEPAGHAMSPMGNPPRYRSHADVLCAQTGEGWKPSKVKDDARAKGRGWNTTAHPKFYEGHVKGL